MRNIEFLKPLLMVLFFNLTSILVFGQETLKDEYIHRIESEQKKVIQDLLFFIKQDSAISILQAGNIFGHEILGELEYSDSLLTEERRIKLDLTDSYKQESLVFKKILLYRNKILPDLDAIDPPMDIQIELESSKIPEGFSGDLPMVLNQYVLKSDLYPDWSIQIRFYGHPYRNISKIYVEETEILSEIGFW